MPPFLPKKRLRSESPEADSSSSAKKGKGKATAISTTPRKPTLFDDIDAGTGSRRTAAQSKVLLEKLADSDDDDESSLSSVSDQEFEDVPNTKRQKTAESSGDDEDIEFEDVDTGPVAGPSGPAPSGDLELTLRKDTRISLTNPFGTKKGPTKIERQIRISTHQVHVQMLMFHNAIRNSWLCNQELQQILLKQLPSSIMDRVGKWRQDSGLVLPGKKQTARKHGTTNNVKGKRPNGKPQRDWGGAAKRLEEGNVDLSRGDPLLGLLRRLVPYWKQRFRITAPGLRKMGYMSLPRLDDEMKSFHNAQHDPELHGELIKNVEDLKSCATHMEGSRDVGAQLFTALLRGLGIEARMVANLQPVGLGWSQFEEALEKNPRKLKKPKEVDEDTSDDEDDSASAEEPIPPKRVEAKGKGAAKVKKTASSAKPSRRTPKGGGLKENPIQLSDSNAADSTSDDDSVVDITPLKVRRQPSKPYDKDLLYPHYWTEVLSPVTNTYTAVDPIVLNVITTESKYFEKFEPRGAKSEKARQVISYVIGHSSDGTAKDVTTRYLKNRMWPSRTKGFRIGVEKVPVYNRNGKIKRYEHYDWFKVVMSGYVRGTKNCPRTEVDDHEEATVLKPVKPEKKVIEDGKETLQSYKSSSEFVLERHLRREEALVPTAKHVKTFLVKGKGEESTEEKVFLRKDVVNCKSTETWHKEGRAPLPGEEPLKRVPYRAATTNRRRELAEAEHASGEKMLQGLFSRTQTDWIIPPPIENGIIPKNSFGNIDLYVDSMLPEGAVHIPLRGTVKICKRLEIDYAEAVTGFEFGHRMAVPVITGIVVAEENHDSVMEEWYKDEAERVRKEDEKRKRAAVGTWRKMLMGLRIIKRIRDDYGDDAGRDTDDINPWSGKKMAKDMDVEHKHMQQQDEDMAGGFFPEGHDEEEISARHSSFFPVAHNNDDEHEGGFVVEGHDEIQNLATGYANGTLQASPPNNNAEKGQVMDTDVDMEDEDSEPEPSLPKKRGRPSGSARKPDSSASKSKAKPPAKKSRSKVTRNSNGKPKPKTQLKESGVVDDSELSSVPDSDSQDSDIDSDRLAYMEPTPKRGSGRNGKGNAAVEPVPAQRKTPRRNAARKSETALRSHYFKHSDDDEDDDE